MVNDKQNQTKFVSVDSRQNQLRESLVRRQTYHGPLLVGEEDPDDGLLWGPRVDPHSITGGLEHRQAVGGQRRGLGQMLGGPTSSSGPAAEPGPSHHLDLEGGGGGGGGAVGRAEGAHGLQQLLLPLLEGVQLAGVLLIGLQGEHHR